MIEKGQSEDGTITWEYDTEKGVLSTTFPKGSAAIDVMNLERLALFLAKHKEDIARERKVEVPAHQAILKSGLYELKSLQWHFRWIFDEEDGTLAWLPMGGEATFIQPPDLVRFAKFLERCKASIIAHSALMRKRYDVDEAEFPALREDILICG